MSWLINNKTPEELGVTVASWSQASLGTSELMLEMVVERLDDSIPGGLDVGSTVSLKLNGTQAYYGSVRGVNHYGSGHSEGIALTLRDGFDELDRVMYLSEKDYAKSVAWTDDFAVTTLQTEKVAVVLFKHDVLLGVRLHHVLSYAIEHGGVNLQIGNISNGIKWVTTEHRNQVCGEIIRDIMLLMPEYQLWLDHSTSPPSVNMQPRDALATRVLDLDAGDVIQDIEVSPVVDGRVAGVVIQYEIPISVNGDPKTFLIKDTVGEDEGMDVMYETIGLNSADFSPEYHHVKTRAIPQEDASEDTIIKWWAKHTPELAALMRGMSVDERRDLFDIGSGDNGYYLEVAESDEDEDEVQPLNPNSQPLGLTPDDASDDPKKYPRELIEGSLPIWSNRRWGTVNSGVVLHLNESELESSSLSDEKKTKIRSIFSETIDGEPSAEFTASLSATNAISKNYARNMSYDQNLETPTGIATQLYNQYNKDRASGSVTLKGVEVDLSYKPGQKLSVAGFLETIQTVDYNVADRSIVIHISPPDQLGAQDMIERLRAGRINQLSRGLQADETMIEGTGGTVATPNSKISIVGGGSGGSVECVLGDLLADSESEGKKKIRPGYVTGGGANIFLEKDNITPVIGNHLYIEVSWTAEKEDGVLLSGGSMTAAEIKQGDSVPDDDDFTPTSLTGKHYKALGTWSDVGGSPSWQKAGCGSYHVGMCSNGKTGSF